MPRPPVAPSTVEAAPSIGGSARATGAMLVLLAALALGLHAPALGGVASVPGRATAPDALVGVALRARLHAQGWKGWLADDLGGFPARADRLLDAGMPVDALASWPLSAALGTARGEVWFAAFLTVLGTVLTGAWATRLHGRVGAGLVAGVAWLVGESLLRETAAGRTNVVLGMSLLPAVGWLLWEGARARGPFRQNAEEGGAGPWAPQRPGPLDGDDPRDASGGSFATRDENGSGRAALLAGAGGVVAGIVACTDPNLAPLAVVTLLAAGGRSPHAWRRVLLAAAAGFAMTAGPALAWVVAHRHVVPSLGADPYAPLALDGALVRPVDLVAGRIFGAGGIAGGTLARPVLLLAAGLGLAGAWMRPRGRGVALVATSLTLVGAGLVLGVGAELRWPGGGSVLAPWGLLQDVSLAGRAWGADRAWVAVSLGLAVLAGGAGEGAGALLARGLRAGRPGGAPTTTRSDAREGGSTTHPDPAALEAASRAGAGALRGLQPPPQEPKDRRPAWALPLVVSVLFAAEALALSPSLPLPRVSLTPTPAAALLAQRTGALLLLPTPGGPLRPGRSDLLDQLVHGRPHVQGLRAAGDPRAPAGELRAWATNPALRAALACEQGRNPTETPEDVARGLAQISVHEVVLDLPSVRDAPSYEACVTTALGAWPHEELGELRRWWAP